MTDNEKKLRDQLIKVWDKLGEKLLQSITLSYQDMEILFDEIGDTLNATDPETENMSSYMRMVYSTYQPIEALRMVLKMKNEARKDINEHT